METVQKFGALLFIALAFIACGKKDEHAQQQKL